MLVGAGMMSCRILKRLKIKQRGADEYHGVGGPLSVEDIRIKLRYFR